MQIPTRAGELAGWAGAAFLVGIAIHSVWTYVLFPEWVLDAGVATGVALIFWATMVPVFRNALFRFALIGAGTIILFATIGVWRFEIAIPTMPRGLIPFSAQGLAYAKNGPLSWFVPTHQALTERATTIFSKDEGTLLLGILYGDRGLSKEWQDRFRRAGMLHIIAVSGSNVTVVVILVMPVLLAIGLPRRFAFVVLSAALVAFVLFVGASASVVRAAIMGWLVEFAPVVGRIPRASRLLLIAAVAFSFWQPWALLFDAGFALSFLAMWGLLTWSRVFQEYLSKRIPSEMVSEILASSMGATLMTSPYIAWSFGNASAFGILTNVFALPLLPWIMVTGALALAAPSLYTILPARGFLTLLLWIARIPDYFSYGTWSHLSTPFSVCASCYAVILMIWLFIQRRKRVIPKNTRENEENLSDDGQCL